MFWVVGGSVVVDGSGVDDRGICWLGAGILAALVLFASLGDVSLI